MESLLCIFYLNDLDNLRFGFRHLPCVWEALNYVSSVFIISDAVFGPLPSWQPPFFPLWLARGTRFWWCPNAFDYASLIPIASFAGTSADDLYPLFDRYGKVVDIFIPRDRR